MVVIDKIHDTVSVRSSGSAQHMEHVNVREMRVPEQNEGGAYAGEASSLYYL